MKKKIEIVVFLVFFGIIFSGISFIFNPSDLPTTETMEEEITSEPQETTRVKTSGDHSPIVIDDTGASGYTWAQAKSAGICSGSGTIRDPYIIEGLSIDGERLVECITIKNSIKHFIIRNCLVFNSKLRPSGQVVHFGGIRLENAQNGIITDNEALNNEVGIYITYSDNNQIINNIAENNAYIGILGMYNDNNEIVGNQVYNNRGAGIYLVDCHNNLIKENTVSHPGGRGIQIRGNYNVVDSNIVSWSYIGVELQGSYNTLSNNIISGSFRYGIQILIGNNYQIINNKVFSSGAGLYMYGLHGTIIISNEFYWNGVSIILHESDTNQILDNYIHDNTNDGIRIHSTSNNNIFSDNILEGNLRGINSYSSSNLFYKNYLLSNSQNALDNGYNNQWDNGNIGNYWGNYSGIDADYDGIGDTPHYVFGSAGSQDNFPIFNAYPDFAISQDDIDFELGAGETDVQITITNLAIRYEGVIKISFEELSNNTLTLLEEKFVTNLGTFKSKTISSQWTPKLFHFLVVSIDPQNLISELDKSNNVAKRGGGGNSPTTGKVWSDYGDWSDVNTVGPFFKSIKLLNTFYVEIFDLDGDVLNVVFDFNDQKYNGARDTGNFWKFEHDMGDLISGDNRLEITAQDTLDFVSEIRKITIKIVEIPSWITDYTGDVPPSGEADWIKLKDSVLFIYFTINGTGSKKKLHGDVPNVGGSSMSPQFEITFILWWDLLTGEKKLSIEGAYEFNTTLGGRDLKIKITIVGEGTFNDGFELEKVEISVEFELRLTLWGGKFKAKKYVEIGIGLDLDFKFIFKLVFEVINHELEWAESQLKLYLGLVGWLKFKVDGGFLGFNVEGEAGGGIVFDFLWSKEGFSWGFDGYLRVSYKVEVWFLFFHFYFGGQHEWGFSDRSPPQLNKTSVDEPWNWTKDYSTLTDSRPRVATDGEGNAVMVWTQNRNESGIVYTDICYSDWNGTDWNEANYLTYDNNADFDPALTYDSNGNVVVVWSRLREDFSSVSPENPMDLFEAQEIAYSMWDGTTWTKPKLLTNDNYANGRAVISAGSNGEVIAVWVGDPDHNFTTTKDLELFYSVWDGTHWSAKIQFSNNDYMDYSASLSYDSMGNAMLCWITDLDGNRTTTSDTQLLYSLWDRNSWSEPSKVIDSDENKESPSIKFDLNDNSLITWVGRTENKTRLYFSCWNKTTNEWSTPEIVHEDAFFIFNPSINVDLNNTAVIVWRGFEDNEAERDYYFTHNATETYFDGEICYATKDLTRPDSVWSELKYLTSNNKTDWMASAVIIKGHSNDLLLVWDMEGEINNLIHEIKPDLFVRSSDILFSNEHPKEGEAIDITSTIYNIGDIEAKDISVYFYNGDPNYGGVLIGTTLIDLDYDKKIDVTIPWVAQSGSNDIYVVIDHENLISELNETNNIAFKTVDISPDLTLSSTDISFSNINPIEGEDIFIRAIIRNFGGTKAENFEVKFYDGNNIIETVEVALLNSNNFIEIPVIWTATPGAHNITVVIDPIDDILEWNETNNNATATIFVYPDVKLISFDISNDILIHGEIVELSGELQNIGLASANQIYLELYDGNPFIDGVLLYSLTIPRLEIGEDTSFSFFWVNPSPGLHKVFAIIDSQNMIDESDETNNLLYQELMVLNLPDLTISEPEFIYTTNYIEIITSIENIGAGGATGVVIDLYDGNPLTTGVLIVSKLITYMGAGQSEVVSLKMFKPPNFDNIYLIVDTKNIIEESSEVNNQLIIQYVDIIKVDAGPDQQVGEDEPVEFSAKLYGGISGDFIFLWDFGDGNTGENIIITHQYGDNGVYLVTLTVIGPNYLATDQLIIAVSNVAPTVNAGLDQTVNEDDVVNFSGAFEDPGSSDTHVIKWYFGDGSTDSGDLYPTHIYTDNGLYTAILIVTDDDGGVGIDIMNVNVLNVIPVANAGPNQVTFDGEIILLNAGNSWDTPSDLPNLEYNWDFGDDTYGTGILTTHSYLKSGIYSVTLTVIDNDGGMDSNTLTVTVNNVAPSVDAGPDATSSEGAPISFAGGFIDPGDDTHEYQWDFGDGTIISGSLTPIHIYEDNGVYIANLTVTDNDGGVGTDTVTITVNNVAPTIIDVDDRVVEEDKTYFYSWTFTDPGIWDTHSATINWGDGSLPESGIVSEDQGDGTVSASHIYTMPSPSYPITIILTDKDGGECFLTFEAEVLDRTSPETTVGLSGVKGNGNWYVSDVTVMLTAIDEYSDIYSICYSYGSVNMEIYDVDSTWFVVSDEGEITIHYYSIDTEGNIESTKTLTLYIDKTAPTTTLVIQGPQSILDATTYVSTATTFMLEATDVDFPFGSGVDIIEYRIDSDDIDDWIEYSESFSISEIGIHTIDYRSIDVAGNEDEIKSIEIVINDSELTYLGELEGTYSDPVVLKANLTDIATGLPIPYKTIVFTIGTQTFTAETDITGIASHTLILNQSGGDYIVYASFADDGEYLASDDDSAFTINKEYAYAEYTGDMVVPLNAETITLRATIYDEDDGNWGDLTKIYINITIWDSTNVIPLYTSEPIEVEITIVDGVGVATISIPNNYLEDSYLVQISIDPNENDYYWGDNLNFFTLIIYEPVGDFVTGGGWIVDANGNKGNFGFNVKYKKNGLPKGQAIYVYREGDYIFIIKANAWVGMAIISEENYTIFEAKCNVKQVNAITGEIVWEEGNYRLIIEAWDHSKDGKGDIIQIRVYDRIGILYSEIGFDPYGYLIGGNIVIHIDEKK